MKALLVKQPWIDKILSGAKVWELRGTRTSARGPIALIQVSSGTVVGVCEVVDVKGPLSRSELRRTTSRHRVPNATLRDELRYRKTYAWVLRGARRLRAPVRYRHRLGAVIWVELTSHVVKAVTHNQRIRY